MSNNKRICFRCLRTGPLEVFDLPELGVGSAFHGFSSELHLCPDCLDLEKREWLKLAVMKSDTAFKYQYEEALLNWINSFPIEGRERFYNTYAYGWRVRYQTSEAWIQEHQASAHGNCRNEDVMKQCEESIWILYPDGTKRIDCPFNSDRTCNDCPRFISRSHAPQEIKWNQVKEFCSQRYDAIRRIQENQSHEQIEALAFLASKEAQR